MSITFSSHSPITASIWRRAHSFGLGPEILWFRLPPHPASSLPIFVIPTNSRNDCTQYASSMLGLPFRLDIMLWLSIPRFFLSSNALTKKRQYVWLVKMMEVGLAAWSSRIPRELFFVVDFHKLSPSMRANSIQVSGNDKCERSANHAQPFSVTKN